MKKIDYDSWPRREIFEFFSAVSDPFYSLSFNLDVSRLYKYVKARGLSFYYALIYLSSKAMNSVEAFRYALDKGEPVLLGERSPSFTDLKKGSDSFYIVTLPLEEDMESFCAAAAEKSREQQCFIDHSQETGELIYFSSLPWLELTALTNERDFDRDDAIPRIAWGRYRDEDGRKIVNMSLELNHRFVDGVHAGMFASALERLISELGE